MVDISTVASQFEDDVVVVAARSPEFEQLPARWRAIADETDPRGRARLALALWNAEFTSLLSGFAARLDRDLVDVLPCIVGDEPALVYVSSNSAGSVIVWVGRDARSLSDLPEGWDAIPAPVRAFLADVHAGFTAPDGESYGLLRPQYMETLSERADMSDDDPNWLQEDLVPSRLLLIGQDFGNLEYYVSADAPGQVVTVYEGDVDEPTEFGPEFDAFLLRRFDSDG